MNKNFFNGKRRKKRRRKTRKKRGGVYCRDNNTKKDCLDDLPECYWKPINLKYYSGTKMSKKFGICLNQKSRKVMEFDEKQKSIIKKTKSKKSKSKNRTPSQILKNKSKNRADILLEMKDNFKDFDTPRINSCCTISGGRKKKTRKKRGGCKWPWDCFSRQRENDNDIEEQPLLRQPSIGNIIDSDDDAISLPSDTSSDSDYSIEDLKKSAYHTKKSQRKNAGGGKKTRRKRRKKRDNAGCLPWRRRRRKKTKKSKTPSIKKIIKELEESNNPIDEKIVKELQKTLKGREVW
jgi:hypothetical protein